MQVCAMFMTLEAPCITVLWALGPFQSSCCSWHTTTVVVESEHPVSNHAPMLDINPPSMSDRSGLVMWELP